MCYSFLVNNQVRHKIIKGKRELRNNDGKEDKTKTKLEEKQKNPTFKSIDENLEGREEYISKFRFFKGGFVTKSTQGPQNHTTLKVKKGRGIKII